MKSLILFLITCSNIFAQQNKSTLLNFDSLYETKCTNNSNGKEGEKSFLRFYVDLQVISVGTECDATAADLRFWFNLDMDNLSVGNYKIKNRRILFSTTSEAEQLFIEEE